MRKLKLAFPVVLIGLVLLGLACNTSIVPPSAAPSGTQRSDLARLTILHTNDTHAALDDIGRRATLVKQIRGEAGKDNVLLVDSGDVFNGTLYFTVARGQADLWFMQFMGYEAMSLGNHEFDLGPGVLSDFVSKAGFPILSANFDFSEEKTLAGKIQPVTVIPKNGERYGLFGLTIESTGELSSPGPNIVIRDAVPAAQQAVTTLQKQGVNKIIALTHIGWDKDIDLAKKVKGIDIIIGGHSHTVPEVYPTVINENGTPTLVVQAGAQGKYLGKLNVSFDKDGILKNWDGSQLIAIDQKIDFDPACTAKLGEYQKLVNEMLNTILGKTLVELDGDRDRVRSQETSMGNLLADAMLSKAASAGATVAIINGGAIRSSVPAGDFSLGQVMKILPFGNYLTVLELNGQQLTAALENGVSQVEQAAGRFPQVAGLRYTWNPKAEPGRRIVSIEIKTPEGYKPVVLSNKYIVATNDFLAGGGDGYTAFREAGHSSSLGITDYDVLRDYIKANSPLNIAVEGRIRRFGE